MLGPARRQQEPDQRENDVASEIDERLVGARVQVERERDDEPGGRQGEHGPPELRPPPGTEGRDDDARRRQAVHHTNLLIRAINRA